MKERIITGFIMIAVIVCIMFFLPILFQPFVGIILGIAIWEWCRTAQILVPARYVFAAVTVALWLAATYSTTLFTVLLYLTTIHYLYALFLIIRFERQGTPISKRDLLVSGPIVLATLASTLIYIFHQSEGISQTDDALSLTFIIMIIAAADTGAYFVGRAIGKHKLAPKTSPKKTREGLLGGLLAVIAVVIVGRFMVEGWELSVTQLILMALIAAVFSVIGDLFISIIKRQNHIKDTSQILPGHGGILDRIDGLLAGVSVFYLLYQVL